MLPTTCEAPRRFVGRLQSSCSRFGHLGETADSRGWLGRNAHCASSCLYLYVSMYVCHQKYRVCGSVVQEKTLENSVDVLLLQFCWGESCTKSSRVLGVK